MLILTLSVLPLRYYGCGLVVPECLEGCRILDLGSGSGRDCYMLSQLVGEKGHVTGIDMTEKQVVYISSTVWTVSFVNGLWLRELNNRQHMLIDKRLQTQPYQNVVMLC